MKKNLKNISGTQRDARKILERNGPYKIEKFDRPYKIEKFGTKWDEIFGIEIQNFWDRNFWDRNSKSIPKIEKSAPQNLKFDSDFEF